MTATERDELHLDDLDKASKAVAVFSRCWAFFGLLLFAVTWRLWFPQSIYPQVPLFEFLTSTPRWGDWCALTIAIGSLMTILLVGWPFEPGNESANRSKKTLIQTNSLILFAISVFALIAIDQHRLQPWALQFLLFAVVMIIAPRRSSLDWMRVIVISIYLYSAISKFDYQFLHTVGQQFLETLASMFGASADNVSPSIRLWIVAMFPLGELLVGIGLLVPRTRRIATIAAVVLHLSLIMILGPLGMQHQPGVLVWNAFFACQAILLFWPCDVVANETKTKRLIRPRVKGARELIAASVACVAVIFPATESIDICDHWPAWDLYSPRSSRAHVFVHRVALKELPPNFRKFAIPEDDSLWVRLRIDQWSLESLGVPVYPEDRFQLAIARALDERFSLDRKIRVDLASDSNRFTGVRSEKILSGSAAIEQASEEFRVNTKSRQGFARDE